MQQKCKILEKLVGVYQIWSDPDWKKCNPDQHDQDFFIEIEKYNATLKKLTL